MTTPTAIQTPLLRLIEAAAWRQLWEGCAPDSWYRHAHAIAHHLGGPDPDGPVFVQRRADRAVRRGLA